MNLQEFYAQHSDVTDPGAYDHLFEGLPLNIRAMSEIIQGVAMHRDHTNWRFGFVLPEERYREGDTRRVRDILKIVGDLSERPARDRFAGTCRDFCVLLCSMLRHNGVPARIRGGYANYFPRLGGPRLFDDHWVVEHWHPAHGWRLTDGQVAASANADYQVTDFDPVELPRDRFLVAGEAWRAIRAGERDEHSFYVSGLRQSGLPIIYGTVVRDLAALNRVEGFPWDVWGLMTTPYDQLTDADLALLDQAAAIGAEGGPWQDAVDLYRANPRLQAPAFC